ncbi:MAG: hypothetical protein H7242_19575 [Microbacteriaceae bacterium]|nr:hypothetical protein [Burkholderiaceae bacterium]
MNTFNTARLIQSATALGLSLAVTLVLLGSLNNLATEQHAATVLAKATAALQAQQAKAAADTAARS